MAISLLRRYDNLPSDLKDDLNNDDIFQIMMEDARHLEKKGYSIYEAALMIYLTSDEHDEAWAIDQQKKIACIIKAREDGQNHSNIK